MMSRPRYTLLRSSDNVEKTRSVRSRTQTPIKKLVVTARSYMVLILLLLVSLATNAYMLILFPIRWSATWRSPFTGFALDVPVVYHAHSDYWGENETLANEMWEAIDTNPIAVALDNEWAEQHGLPEAGPFPWDNSKGTYFVKAFHQLHCLKLIRHTTLEYRIGRQPLNSWRHYEHCLDTLRKDIVCRADSTPIAGHPERHLGEGQIMQCGDWDRLVAWTQAPERQSCYRHLDDYREIKHTLERYAFCPEDSPYYEVQTAYFEEFGHQQIFEDELP